MIWSIGREKFAESSLAMPSADTFFNTFAEASASNPLNTTIARLGQSEEDMLMVRDHLREMGQNRFINLSRNYKMSASVLSMYAGGGIVAKVIAETELSHTNGVIFYLPAIKQKSVEGKTGVYHIKFYPWVPSGNTKQLDVDFFAMMIEQYGMKMNNGDALPKNVHRLPDRNGTMVGIDSDMYHSAFGGLKIPDQMIVAWHQYLHALYPIYKTGNVPAQTETTNFSFMSLHDPNMQAASFEEFSGKSGSIKPPSSEVLGL